MVPKAVSGSLLLLCIFSVYSAGFRNNFQYHRLPWNNLYSRRRLFVSRNKLSEVSNRKWMETKSHYRKDIVGAYK
jgi:hypothetical protein